LEAFQFGWLFTYPGPNGKFCTPDDLVQTTFLTVPAGQVIRLIIGSKDVIHSFYVPQLRLRQDAVPGREIPAPNRHKLPVRFAEMRGEARGSRDLLGGLHHQYARS
jgi:heme/copper-type cytochrome/quinol oxidase subunit 2